MVDGKSNATADPLIAVVVARPPDSLPLTAQRSRRRIQGTNAAAPTGRFKGVLPGALLLLLGASMAQLFYFHQNADSFGKSGPSVLGDEWKVDDAPGGFVGARGAAVSKKRPNHPTTNGGTKSSSVSRTTVATDPKENKPTKKDNGRSNSIRTNAAVTDPKENPLYKLFQAANVNASELSDETLASVYASMGQMYGDMTEPLVLGLDTCATYRATVPLKRRYAAVAGLFNTGTNAMEFHLDHNIPTLPNKWQVPWGKHRVPQLTRLMHVAPGMEKAVQEDCLPVVMMRDPYNWMQSMCKSPYAADWHHKRQHCPNLVPTLADMKKFGSKLKESTEFPVTVTFDEKQIVTWNSLVHLYNDWNRQYVDASYPRLLVRFEDMLLHAPTILAHVAACAGVPPTTNFTYQVHSAKGHGSHTDFAKAVLKSGDMPARVRNMTTDDLRYVAHHLDKDLMRLLHYTIPSHEVEATVSPF